MANYTYVHLIQAWASLDAVPRKRTNDGIVIERSWIPPLEDAPEFPAGTTVEELDNWFESQHPKFRVADVLNKNIQSLDFEVGVDDSLYASVSDELVLPVGLPGELAEELIAEFVQHQWDNDKIPVSESSNPYTGLRVLRVTEADTEKLVNDRIALEPDYAGFGDEVASRLNDYRRQSAEGMVDQKLLSFAELNALAEKFGI